MRVEPVLMLGGTGMVGAATARLLRQAWPTLPLLIGGRDFGRAHALAVELGHAEAVVIDLRDPALGLGERKISMIAAFVKDERLTSLHHAQRSGIPFLGISTNSFEVLPEVAAYMRHPASTVVMGSEWLCGAAVLATLFLARGFNRLESIHLSAIVDANDVGGEATIVDFERLRSAAPAALTLTGGAYRWRHGDEMMTRVKRADGAELHASAYSPLDIAALAEQTGAADVSFDIAVGETSSRARGDAFSTEIIIALTGEDANGKLKQSRHALVHPAGQVPMTALTVAMMIERLTGCDGGQKPGSGLLFPEHLLEPEAFFARAKRMGTTLKQI